MATWEKALKVRWPDGKINIFTTSDERNAFVLRIERRGDLVARAYSPEDEYVEFVKR